MVSTVWPSTVVAFADDDATRVPINKLGDVGVRDLVKRGTQLSCDRCDIPKNIAKFLDNFVLLQGIERYRIERMRLSPMFLDFV